MRVVGYFRVSTADQAEDGVSLRAQAERYGQWCAAQGKHVEQAEAFRDEGLSGKRSDNRPGLAAALDAACVPGGVLVVYSLSRLARSVRDTLAIAERLERSGADLVSLSEQIDTTSAAGKMVFRMLAVLAEFERDLAVERTRGALAYKRSRGERLGQVPYGRRLAGDGVTLDVDEEELARVAWIRARAADGWSRRAIARELDRLGAPTKNGGRWSKTTVGRLINRGE